MAGDSDKEALLGPMNENEVRAVVRAVEKLLSVWPPEETVWVEVKETK